MAPMVAALVSRSRRGAGPFRLPPLPPFLLAAAVAALLAGCSTNPTLVVANRLAVDGEAGNGGTGDSARPQLDILVRMESDATDFNPGDLLRLVVNGVERTDDVLIGGNYALLRLDPSPVGTPQFVELFRRTGPVLDTFTYNALPFAGPTLASVTPDEAAEGEQVTLAGTGFAAAAVRVFFGGVEGTVDASDDTSITATVPPGARPGPVWVLVGAEAAEGLVGFQPLDAAGQPVPLPDESGGPLLFAAFPARGGAETPVRVIGLHFDQDARGEFNGRRGSRVVGVETITLAPVGDFVAAFAVVDRFTAPAASDVVIEQDGDLSDPLPFTVDATP